MSVSGRTTDHGDREWQAEAVNCNITELLVARQLSNTDSQARSTNSITLNLISAARKRGGRCSLRDYNVMKADHNDNINQCTA